jgi:hypothetical protein
MSSNRTQNPELSTQNNGGGFRLRRLSAKESFRLRQGFRLRPGYDGQDGGQVAATLVDRPRGYSHVG